MRAVSVLALLAALTASACASSVLVRHDDSTFREAQQRLARTGETVERDNPPVAEKWLFLQGESLYQYRYSPPPRGALTYFAQAAAAAADFPALQAFAGSLDLLDLRLRTYDGAVHLWETLLDQYPATRLRPLTLYRLGWAYRSRGAAGFPRGAGDEAFDLLVKEQPGSPLAALAKEARSTRWKSKDTATGLSIVPGLGQFYVGERWSGVARLAVALAAVAMVVAPTVIAYQRRTDLTWKRDWPLLATGVGGLIILSIDYTTAYQDALRGVVLYNERVESEFTRRHPDAP
jgi:hypothetical protein